MGTGSECGLQGAILSFEPALTFIVHDILGLTGTRIIKHHCWDRFCDIRGKYLPRSVSKQSKFRLAVVGEVENFTDLRSIDIATTIQHYDPHKPNYALFRLSGWEGRLECSYSCQ